MCFGQQPVVLLHWQHVPAPMPAHPDRAISHIVKSFLGGIQFGACYFQICIRNGHFILIRFVHQIVQVSLRSIHCFFALDNSLRAEALFRLSSGLSAIRRKLPLCASTSLVPQSGLPVQPVPGYHHRCDILSNRGVSQLH